MMQSAKLIDIFCFIPLEQAELAHRPKTKNAPEGASFALWPGGTEFKPYFAWFAENQRIKEFIIVYNTELTFAAF